jgi:hypothetical protein
LRAIANNAATGNQHPIQIVKKAMTTINPGAFSRKDCKELSENSNNVIKIIKNTTDFLQL